MTGTRFERNVAGAGGAGGNARGGNGVEDESSATANITGGGALAFGSGAGGDGGAVWAGDGASISGSTFVSNSAGAGGPGGATTGGTGGSHFGNLTAQDPPRAGTGGGALTATSGRGGGGGGLYVAAGASDITASTFTTNVAGAGGAAGTAAGGTGGFIIGLDGAGGAAQGGTGGAGGDGGAIGTAAGTGTLALSASTLAGNRSGAGGTGGAAVGGSEPRPNFPPEQVNPAAAGSAQSGQGGASGAGGAVAVAGGARLVNVTLDANATSTGGAGGTATPGKGNPPASTEGNFGGAPGAGGGFATLGASTDTAILNSTISGNAAGNAGAFGPPGGGGIVTHGGAALARSAGTLTLTGGVVADSPTRACFSASGGSIADGGGNVRSNTDASCPGTVGDAGLGALRDNGGPVFTRAIGAGGAAINAAPSAGCPDTDARGAKRPAGGGCDAGAYELSAPTAATGGVKGVGRTGGTLTGTIDSHGPPASVRFEYGKTTKYGKTTALQSLTPGFGGRAVSAAMGGYTTGTVVHYRVLVATADGSEAGADGKFTVGSKDHTPPKLSKLSVSPKRFAVSSKRTAVSAKKKVPHGTAFRLKVSEKSSVTFSIALKTTGRKVKKTIRKKGSKKKSVKTVCAARGHHRVTKKTRCTLYVHTGTLRRSLKTGAHRVAFSGRIGRKALKPGTYRVTIRATDAAKNRSKTSTLTFTVVHG